MHASKPEPVRIRLATQDDTAGVLAVYAPYVPTPITFEETAPSLDEFRTRMALVQASHPFLVAVTDSAEREPGNAARERIAGFAYAHAQHERAAYGWNAELSVYLAPESRGRGLGAALYRTLIDLLTLQGFKAAYALVTLPNQASERLHAALGFELMGLQRNAGYTCGAWRDVAWLVKPLAPFESHPAPVEPFPALASTQPETVRAAIDRANAGFAVRRLPADGQS